MNQDIKIFACNSNKTLATSVSSFLSLSVGASQVGRFSDGEINLKVDEIVRGADVYIIQSTSGPVNENLMELLIMIDALRRASAGRINAVIPYFGYARQDRKTKARDPISAKLVANLITTAGAERVVSIDLHCAQIQGFFDIPVDHLYASPLFINYCINKYKDLSDVVIVSPDLGSVSRTRSFAERLNVPLAIVDKRRQKANVSEVMNIIGSVENKRVIMIDDVIDTAGTISNAANALRANGAKDISVFASHGIFSGPALANLENSAIDEVVITDTINQEGRNLLPKIKVISVANLLAEAIDRIHRGDSISKLFV